MKRVPKENETSSTNVQRPDAPAQKKSRMNTTSPIMRKGKSQVHESSFTEELAQETDVNKQVWARPAPPPIDPKTTDIAYQWVDMDTYIGEPLAKHPVQGRAVPGSNKGPVPIIRMFGVTDKGHSVMVHVHGVTPYFYCDTPSADFKEEDCGLFRQTLNAMVKQQARGADVPDVCVVAVIPMQKQSLLGYHGGEYKTFLQVSMALPSLVSTARTILSRSFTLPGYHQKSYMTYESNVPFELRYMVDNNIVGANWCELKRGTYLLRSPNRHVSTCQVELDVVFDSLVSHPTDAAQWLRIAPLRILSFDIECMGRRGIFPDPKVDPVIQIANFVTLQGEKKAFVRNVFVLNTCLPIVGAEVLSFKTERELLSAWSKFVREVDPDILTGYNIQNFDIKYLLERAEALRIKDFAYLGKIKNSLSRMKSSTFSSSAYGTRENTTTSMEGRVMMDMIAYMFRNHKLSSYSLNAVSAEFLGQQKEEVHHSIISDLQQGSDEDRRRLAVYCLKDAYLPQQLMDKLMVLINYVEMARVTGVPIPFLFSRGQQIKVLSMLYRKAAQHRLIIPVLPKTANTNDKGVGFEGATVIEPIKGYYDEPIATLDFASLYPSIMMAHNLCYTTLLSKEDIQSGKVKPDEYEKTPTGHCFVRGEKSKGILPTILNELLTARKAAKKDMKKATDPLEKAVMNGRQLALKISANSVYGFTGATVGALPCLPISASVTSFGRQMIDDTKKAVEEQYTIANGYPADAVVIYGDTDSVMVKFGVKDVKTAMDMGFEAAAKVTKIFKKPIALEFEKVYYPYLLMNKKRYAGVYWTNPEKSDKMDCKGIETVRRDNCGLVRIVIGTCLRKILRERNVQSAIDYVKSTISSLLLNKVDISLLIITKSLSGKSEDYAAKQAHVELAKRMRERDAGSAPVVGDRVPYVIIKAAKGAQAFMKSEDPIYVLENNIPIDFNYYLENQLSKPLIRLFGPIIPNPESTLLKGEHTRSVYKATPSSNIGIMRFAVKTMKCLGCKVPLPKNSKASLCVHCEEKRPDLYLAKVAEANALEERFSKLWTQCQRCQGSLHQDVLCTSKDCPIFYMRKKVQKDLNEAQSTLSRFEDW